MNFNILNYVICRTMREFKNFVGGNKYKNANDTLVCDSGRVGMAWAGLFPEGVPCNNADNDGDDDVEEGEQRVEAPARPLELGGAHALDDELALGVGFLREPRAGGVCGRGRAQGREEDDHAEDPEWGEY